MTATIIDTIAHLDFDPVIPCELRRCQARHPRAAWILYAQAGCGCGRAKACCESCRLRLERQYAAHRAEPGPWRCLICCALVTTHSTIRFTPLRGDKP